MTICNDKQKLLFKICINIEDFYIIMINLIIISCVIISFMFKLIIDYKRNYNVEVKVINPFTPLGEGALSNFYTVCTNTKNANAKKKVSIGKNIPDKPEGKSNTYDLKCNNCNRSCELSHLIINSK